MGLIEKTTDQLDSMRSMSDAEKTQAMRSMPWKATKAMLKLVAQKGSDTEIKNIKALYEERVKTEPAHQKALDWFMRWAKKYKRL